MVERMGGSPHWHDNRTISGLMTDVCIALVPGLLCYVWLFGAGVLIQCVLALLFAFLFEFAVLKLRRRDPWLFLRDGSAAVTALLFAVTITPLSAWWVSLCGIAFAIIISKHVFGGIGYNIFNPAMAGYVFVLACFPVQMNAWPDAALGGPGVVEYLGSIFSSTAAAPDMISGATPLYEMKTRLGLMDMVSEIRADAMFGYFGGAGWEWINLLFALGGVYLLIRGVIKWHIPVAVLAGVFIISALLHLYDTDAYASPLFHLFSGGTMLCAFFIATDPVTASTTNRGRLIYGGLIGILICLIRYWGIFPDGVAFAVLIANAFVPLIDLLTRPKVFGEV